MKLEYESAVRPVRAVLIPVAYESRVEVARLRAEAARRARRRAIRGALYLSAAVAGTALFMLLVTGILLAFHDPGGLWKAIAGPGEKLPVIDG